MVGDIPEMVHMVLDGLLGIETFQDFRIVGNKNGTSVVLRYAKMDMGGSPRHSPVWQHRSQVNMTRDSVKLNTWISEHSLDNNNPVSSPGHVMQANKGGIEYNTCHELNVDAPVFQTQLGARDYPLGTATSSQCETGSQTELPSTCETVGTQTDRDDKSFDSKGTQYKLETRSVGLTCKISPVKKSRYIQAVPTTKNQGIGISVGTKDNETQYDSKQNLVVI
jgi:hypothetical protein